MPDRPRTLRLGDPVGPLRTALLRGEVAAVPTESSYALAADPRSAPAVELVFELKRRERGKALPVVAASLEQILQLGAAVEDPALRWAMGRWPAPLTVLVSVATRIPAMGAEPSLGVRIPGHAGLRSLLGDLGLPLTATSANRAGEEPITRAEDLRRRFGASLSFVVDAGDLPGGPPSTVVAWERAEAPDAGAGAGRPQVLREGAFRWPGRDTIGGSGS